MNEESDVFEWEFPVPSSQVDLERIADECNNIPAVFTLAYLEKLKEKAPIVFERLKQWATKEGCMSYYNWSAHKIRRLV